MVAIGYRGVPGVYRRGQSMRLAGCVAVVTGGASGIGRVLAERLLARGIVNACLGPLWDPVAVRIAFDAAAEAAACCAAATCAAADCTAPADGCSW